MPDDARTDPPPVEVTAAAYGLPLEDVERVIRALRWPRGGEGYFLDTTFGEPAERIEDWETVHFWYRQGRQAAANRGEGTDVGKVTRGGYYSSPDQIPQPASIITGANLRRPDATPVATPPRPRDGTDDLPEPDAVAEGD
jgi:hypothetical protein